MKRAMVISIFCAVFLTACGNVSKSAESENSSVTSQTTVTAIVSAETSAKEEKDTSEAATTTFKTSSQTVSETSKPTNITVTTTKKSDPSGYSGNSSQGQNNSAQNNNYHPVQNNPQPDNSPSNDPQSNNSEEHQNNEPSATQSTTAKQSASALPAITNPPVTTTKPQTTTVPQTQPPLPVPTEEERYMDIGRSLSHNGSDYSKAEAVYNWMTENGSGTCVNFSWQTYYLCKGTGLECYLAWTPSKLYGHVANVVKVNGTWFVLDTQGQGFLLNNDCGFSEIIDIDESYVSGADLISNQRYDEIY
jgi:transglutaminase domain protein